MSVTRERFEFALSKAAGGDWLRFEKLSSAFLVSDFAGIRTMASPGGDDGRDAELFTYADAPSVMIQYSVQSDWKVKIAKTLKRIGEKHPETTALIYVTNQEIGAQGDTLKKELRGKGVHLDIRDMSWFADRLRTDDQRFSAANEFTRAITDSVLSAKAISSTASALTTQEAKTALVFLEMQARDEDTSKGLTRASFESLVRAALQGSSESSMRSRADIHSRIKGFLPRHTAMQLAQFIDAALQRMSKSVIKRHPGELFHLSFDEAVRTKDRLADLAILDEAFSADVADVAADYHGDDQVKIDNIANLVRKVVEAYLYRLGEEFAQAVTHDRDVPLHHDSLRNVVMEVAPKGRALPNESWVDYLYRITIATLTNPSDNTKELLRVLSSSYTLFAFLEEVPDVQKVTKKLFSNATIWLDTSAVLPLFAEQAFPAEDRPFTDMMLQASRSGIKLVMTDGILEELNSHILLCRTYLLKEREWEGRVPYLYQRYMLAGRPRNKFLGWLDAFQGDHRPLDDLSDFLAETAHIHIVDPLSEEELDAEMVNEIKAYWHKVQERRRGEAYFSVSSFRLAEHDIENYLSVLAERKKAKTNTAFGYTSWLMSLDSAAWFLREEVSSTIADRIVHSPTISVDFLVKYLSLGPRRDQSSATSGYTRAFTPLMSESVSPELIAAAEQIRESCGLLGERQVRRAIRDGMDKQRLKLGDVQRGGLDGAHELIASLPDA